MKLGNICDRFMFNSEKNMKSKFINYQTCAYKQWELFIEGKKIEFHSEISIKA